MKKRIFRFIMVISILAGLLIALPIISSAATSGIYTYSVSGGEVTITECSETASGEISIPSAIGGYPVTSIGKHAFTYCSSITSVTIPNSMTSIGEHAFTCCDSLISVTIPSSVTSIGDGAFYSCGSLTNVTIPNSVTSMGDRVFMGCDSLISVTIPGSVTSIGHYAFCNCDSLTSVIIPVSVTSIGNCAFYSCDSITDVYYCGSKEAWTNISIDMFNESLRNATIHYNYIAEEFVEYRINSVTIKDMSGNELSSIPTGTFLATITFTNVSSSADSVIILAQYTDAGTFKGLMYIQTEDVPTGSTIKLSIPVDNTNGDVAKLKAFCWKSFSSLTPLGNTVSFPTK